MTPSRVQSVRWTVANQILGLHLDRRNEWPAYTLPFASKQTIAEHRIPPTATEDDLADEADPFPFLALPVDLQLEVIDKLEFLRQQLLRATFHHFRDIIEAPTIGRLFDEERSEWGQEYELLAYSQRDRLQHRDQFANAMLKGKTGNGV